MKNEEVIFVMKHLLDFIKILESEDSNMFYWFQGYNDINNYELDFEENIISKGYEIIKEYESEEVE